MALKEAYYLDGNEWNYYQGIECVNINFDITDTKAMSTLESFIDDIDII